MELASNSTITLAAVPATERSADAPSDDDLLQRTHDGDQTAFRELVARHGAYLFGIARALSRQAADAEDLVQEAFIGAIASKFRGECAVRTWLVRILVKRAAMLRRSKWRMIFAWQSDSGAIEPAVESPMSASDARMDLARMLESLSPEHREVVVLRELEGMTYEAMAAELGVPRGTVESRLHRAREQLRERFRGYHEV